MRTPLEPRLRRRRRLIWATMLPAIVLVVLAIRFLTLPVTMGTAQDAHGDDDGPGMVSAGEQLGVLNVVERWRAPFVEGTGESLSGDLEAGRGLLEEALERTSSPEDDCTVRTNLVITISQQADAAGAKGDEDAEKRYAEEGLQLIEDGPEGCLNGQQDGNEGEAGRKQQEQKEKLEEQSGQGESEESDDGDQDQDDGQSQGGDEQEEDPKQEELEERNQQGQQESEQDRREEEGENAGDGGSGVEKPW